MCSWFAKIFVIIVSPTVFTFCNKILEMEESSCLVTQYSNFNLTSNQVIYALCMQLFPHKTYCFSSESQMQFEMTRLLHIAHTHWAKTDPIFPYRIPFSWILLFYSKNSGMLYHGKLFLYIICWNSFYSVCQFTSLNLNNLLNMKNRTFEQNIEINLKL